MSAPSIHTAAAEPERKSIGIPSGNLLRSGFRNAAAHFAGRNLISLARLVVASTIARVYGAEVFGQYSLLIVMLAIAEWLLDFGTSDIAVREINRSPERGVQLLRALAATKLIQIGVASAGLVTLVAAMRYPAEMFQGALFGVGSLVFFAGTLVYHTLFKASLTIEREVVAEFVSVLLMIALVWTVVDRGATIPALMACHMVSRAAFFAVCYLLGRARFSLSVRGVSWPDVRSGLRSASALGMIGLVVIVYESMDVLLLSTMASLTDVAYYSGAQRYISPFVVALTGIGSTLYPMAAAFWPHSMDEFQQSCQRATDMVFVIAGLAVCTIFAGAEFLMTLLGPGLASGATILRVLAALLFFKAITNTTGPVLYVLDAQNAALRMVIGALTLKAALIALLAPKFGSLGVAGSALIVDCASAGFTLYLVRKGSGFRVNWSIPIKAVAITFVSAWSASLLFAPANPAAPAAAALLFTALILATGAVRISEIQWLRGAKQS